MKHKFFLPFMFILLVASAVQSQPAFEAISGQDLSVVGITPINLDRWGVSVTDIDGNGWPDVFMTKWRGAQNSQIYMNTDGIFTEISSQSPELSAAEVEESWTRTPSFADYDNDGDKDLFWGSNENMFLFRNDNNVFVDVTSDAGLEAIKPPGLITWWGIEIGAWADYDLDGDLDLLVNQTNNPDYYFYRNDGGVFTNIAAEVGLTGVVPLGANQDQGYWGGRIQWVDFDFDGDPDFSAGTMLFRNDDGVFNEVSEELGLVPAGAETRFSFWFDYDNDGDLDFLKTVCCQSSESPNELFAYQDGQFVDVSGETGISATVPASGSHRSVNIADFDNDGDQDIFIGRSGSTSQEAFILNEETEPGVRAFADIAEFMPGLQVGVVDRTGGAALDYDMDGFMDIFVASAERGAIIFHNLAVNTENHWVGFILEGTVSNRDAVGSLVTLVSDGKRQIRHTPAPDTWKIQENPFVHFGLGTSTTIDSVIIRWPLGNTQVLTDVAIDQYHKVMEGSATSVTEPDGDNTPQTFSLRQNYPNPFNAGTVIEYRLPHAGHVTITVYNVQGQKIRTLFDAHQSAGVFRTEWNGYDDRDEPVPSGVYFYQLETDRFVSIKKALLLK